MIVPGYRDHPTEPWDRIAPVDAYEAEDFLRQCYLENPRLGPVEPRLAIVRAQIAATGSYVHTTDELTYGAKMVAAARVDHDELAGDAAHLADELRARRVVEMTVDVAREDAPEARVVERQRRDVGANDPRARQPACRDREHRLALVERGQLT